MEQPTVFGSFHIAAAALAIAAAVAGAVLLCRKQVSRKSVHKVLFTCGIVLLILELFKQLFLFYIVNGGAYDWWFFPFQLCSVPMYLCILLPLTRGQLRKTFLSFMAGFTFTGALAALIYPEDMLRSYAVLTAHGFIWHSILLFISLTVVLTGVADLSARGSAHAAVLFVLLCVPAVCINIFAEPLMKTAGLPHTYAAMFYLNPFHYSPQPFVSSVQEYTSIPFGLLVYMCAVVLVSTCISILLRRLSKAVIR